VPGRQRRDPGFAAQVTPCSRNEHWIRNRETAIDGAGVVVVAGLAQTKCVPDDQPMPSGRWRPIGHPLESRHPSPGSTQDDRMLKLGLSAAAAACVMACAAWAASAPFVGEWKLNPSKSKLADQMKVESIGANKYAFDFGAGSETVIADGTDQPGYGGTTLAVTVEGPDSWKVVRKKDGHVLLTANWKLSADGSALTDDFTSFAPDGSASNVKYVYERTAAASGFAGTWESANTTVNFEFVIKIQPYGDDGLSLISPSADKPKNLTFDGKDYPNISSSASPGSTYSSRRVDERTFEITDRLNGKVVDTQQIMLSSDRKILTLTVHKSGTRAPSVLVFER